MRIEYVFPDGSIRDVDIVIGQYENTDNLYMGLRSLDGAKNYPLTANIDKLEFPYSALDTKNMGHGVGAFMETYSIADFTGHMVSDGFHQYPVFTFRDEALRAIDSKAYAEYRKSHGQMSDKDLDEVRRLAEEARRRREEKNRNRGPRQSKHEPPELGL